MSYKSRLGVWENTKFLHLKSSVESFGLSVVKRMLNAKNLLELLNLCCFLKSQTYVTTLYPRYLATLIVFILTFLDIVSSDRLFRIPIRSMMWTHGMKLYNQPTNQPRSVGPHKSKPKKTTSKKKTNQINKKSRSVTVLVPEK